MKDGDEPTYDELREISRHPITQRLNREFRELLERRARDPSVDPPVYRPPER